MLRASIALLACAIVLLVSSNAGAREERGRVLLVTVPEEHGGWTQAERRASAELRALGLRVVRASTNPPGGILSESQLIPLVQRTRAVAAVRFTAIDPLDPSGRSPVAVFLVDRSTGKYSIRSVGPDRVDERLSPEAAALLAAELIYASLVRVQSPPRQPDPPPAASPPPAATPPAHVASAPSPCCALRLGPYLGGSPGGVSALGGIGFASTILYARRAGVTLELDAPAVPGRVDGPEGSAHLFIATQRALLRLVAWPGDVNQISLAIGGGVAWAWATATATPPLTDGTETGRAALVAATATWDAELDEGLRLFFALRAALVIPELRVEFAGREVARAGRPLLDGSAGFEWWL